MHPRHAKTQLDFVASGQQAASSRGRVPFHRGAALAAGIFALVLFGLQVLGVIWYRDISIYDEKAHIDYVVRLSKGEIPAWGDTLSQRSLMISECQDSVIDPRQCAAGLAANPEQLWAKGFSYQAQQGPVGYLWYSAVMHFGVADEMSPATQLVRLRLVGAAGIGVFAFIWALIAGMLTGSKRVAMAGTALVVVNPMVFAAFTYVTNDGPALLLSLLTLLLNLFLLRRASSGGFPTSGALAGATLVGLAAGLTKPTILIVPLVLLLAEMASSRRGSARHMLRWRMVVLTQMLAGGFSYFLFTVWQRKRSSAAAGPVLEAVNGASGASLTEAIVSRVGDATSVLAGSVGIPVSPAVTLFAIAGAAVFLVGLASAATVSGTGVRTRELGLLVFAGAGLVIMGIPLSLYVQGGLSCDFVGRYLGPLVPLAAVVSVPTFERFRRVAMVFAFCGMIAAIAYAPSIDVIRGNVTGLAGLLH